MGGSSHLPPMIDKVPVASHRRGSPAAAPWGPKVSGRCVWEFGNMSNGRSFGGAKQYGKVGPGTMGAFAGRVRSQPSC